METQSFSGTSEVHAALPDYIDMYNVPGQDSITKFSLNRYLKDKGQDKKIAAQIENSGASYKQKVFDAPDESRAEFIEIGLTQKNIEVQLVCAQIISWAPENTQAGLKEKVYQLIEAGFATEDVDVQRKYAQIINWAPKNTRAGLIKIGLAKEDTEIQKICAQMIAFLPNNAPFELEEQTGLKEKVYQLIEAGFATEDAETQKAYADMITWSSDDMLVKFINAGLTKKNIETQLAWAQKIMLAPKNAQEKLKEKVYQLIEAGFATEDAETQKAYADMIQYAPKNMRAGLIKIGLAKQNSEVLQACAKMIWHLPAGHSTANLIQEGLATTDRKTQRICAEMISWTPTNFQATLHEKILRLIETGLATNDTVIQKDYLEMIQYGPENTQKRLFLLAQQKLGDNFIESKLYRGTQISKDAFQRKKFTKTGSETTLLGGALMGKAIQRRIEPQAFLAWQKLFEDHAMWASEGFDYVPIEPIISYQLNNNGRVEVYSGVLDLSVGDWIKMVDDFNDELRADMKKIAETLDRAGIKHGHAHEENFCVRFFRDKNGHVDFTKKPRVYLIDFDQAKLAD